VVQRFVAAILTASISLGAQPAEFEVASVKQNKTNERMYYGLRNSRMTIRNMPVKGLIQIAYGKRDFQVTGGPAWITSECFDIEATAESGQKVNTDMLKTLLARRFQLKVHKDTKEALVYSLELAKSGLKMKVSADQSEPEKGGPRELGPGRMVGEGIPMYVITNLLSNMLGRAVVNDTGLTGKYDVMLQPAPDAAALESDPADPLNSLSVIEAVERQLGLEIKSIKGREEVLVIESVERPSAN
jgi:uncharacterized protein (TIGR03435 family)